MVSVMDDCTKNQIIIDNDTLILMPTLQTAWVYIDQIIDNLASKPNQFQISDLEKNNWVFLTLKPSEIINIIQRISVENYDADGREAILSNLAKVATLIGNRCAPRLQSLILLKRKFDSLNFDRGFVLSAINGFSQATDINYIAYSNKIDILFEYANCLKLRKDKKDFRILSNIILQDIGKKTLPSSKINAITAIKIIKFLDNLSDNQLEEQSELIEKILKQREIENHIPNWYGNLFSNYLSLFYRAKIETKHEFLREYTLTDKNLCTEFDKLSLAKTLQFWKKNQNDKALYNITKSMLEIRKLKQGNVSFAAITSVTINNSPSLDIANFSQENLSIITQGIKLKNVSFGLKLTALVGISYQIIETGSPISNTLTKLLCEAFSNWNGGILLYQHAILYGLLYENHFINIIPDCPALSQCVEVKDLPQNWTHSFARLYEVGKKKLLEI